MITILTTIAALLFIIISASCEAVMDKLQFHYDKSIFSNNPSRYKKEFWNPTLSWVNKWKDSSAKEEKFKGSSGIFVFMTDAWHLFKFFKNTSIFFSILLSMISVVNYTIEFNNHFIIFSIILVILYRLFYGLAFVLFFNKILNVIDPFAYMKGNGSASNEIKSTWMDEVNKNK